MTDRIITIDGTDYPLDGLSEQARAQLGNLRFADQELARLKAQMALAQTARNAYAAALKAQLEKAAPKQ